MTHGESDVKQPLNPNEGGPRLPVLAPAGLVHGLAHLPAAELAVEPPALGAVTELEIGEPGGDDGHDGCVEADNGA